MPAIPVPVREDYWDASPLRVDALTSTPFGAFVVTSVWNRSEVMKRLPSCEGLGKVPA
jgi:hypothetical protein